VLKNEEKAAEYIKIIYHETNRLTSLVNRILSFSKMEKDKRGYHFDLIDVNIVINEVIDNFEPHLNNHQVTLKLNLADNLPSIHADREAVIESLINLIDNAVKYGKEHHKKIEIRTFTKSDMLHIEVEDNGMGISKKHQKLVFDKFYRVSGGDLAHKAKGSGLGLNIVKMIMDKHKGKIDLRSSEGEGSCFGLLFPINNSKNG
jgi:two-component system, OmpR family, phosphate regulon sensor histidine kinase PhoR